ncbi:hypothetical protein PCC9214_02835 [Planktothrix tepida]|uniref:Uncharacterized protein n=2 Tax=Planktothrix TaxID=54304 RepID=A0A1J1LPK6_9CYAN|nr:MULTISPECIES: hypothetical protein [Planktothrix]CAD5955016.1 hypothetical protein NO713_02823 [Planktothrix pseudagardhii]CAD5955484.1 hypothetical protein PCC9214_02835 [Planktothrix tepida]CUR34166.1 conserved hypothetical protein [Planktothrix tepida PCC 9214]
MITVLILNPIDGVNSFYHSLDLITQAPILAQQVDVDIVADFVRTWNHILKTGQLWAFFIGVVAGWSLKSLLP